MLFAISSLTIYTVLFVTLFVVAVVLTVTIYMQSGQAKSSGAAFVSNKTLDLFEKRKTRGWDKFLLITTWTLLATFFLVGILLAG